MSTINGTPGNDTLNPTGPYDKLYGLDGDDLIYGATASSFVSGGSGNDTLIKEGTGYFGADGGEGNDLIEISNGGSYGVEGGAGYDTLSFEDMSSGVLVQNRFGFSVSGIEAIKGSAYNDTIDGGDGNQSIWGAAGNDVLRGGAGNDVLIGGVGSDKLWGDAGADKFSFRHNVLLADEEDVINDFGQGDKLELDSVLNGQMTARNLGVGVELSFGNGVGTILIEGQFLTAENIQSYITVI